MRRLRPSGLAGELVVALEEDTDVTASDLERQFARTPYAVSFTTGREELTLVVLHVLWGKERGRACPRAPPDCHLARRLAAARGDVEQEPDRAR
jgi:hypothetical protein